MPLRELDTDYLVVGCGAAGMAFTDALVDASKLDVIMVDRRHAPGGHWNEAYPFVKLHQPAAFYGVSSLRLGDDAIDRHGPNEGLYEQASAAQICSYYDLVMRERLVPTGRVRYFPMCDYAAGPDGTHPFVSRVSGEAYAVTVRKALVDANYLQPSVPASTPPPFEVAPDARCVSVDKLASIEDHPDRHVVVGTGKTAIDACLWLLQGGVSPDAIRWIRPRELLLNNRLYMQCGNLVGNLFEGISLQMEAAAKATSLADLFDRLEDSDQLLRVDERVAPGMYKGATVSASELAALRRIEDVVRLGHVRRVERDRIVLEQGTVPAGAHDLHVHCAARGLRLAPAVPMFAPGRVTLQPIRIGLIPFNAAIVGFIEATRSDLADKNRLCPPNPLPDVPLDWVRGTLIGMNADRMWAKEPDIAAWLEGTRLNAARGLRHPPRSRGASAGPARVRACGEAASCRRAGIASGGRGRGPRPARACACA